ncbi:hypothetical protein GCWU000341_01474 [Oribacterium sp. oral taxon 078 str. F0262]|nr:hypothetical protein GCWU000341_01474 [Oribacterium sp. oral taxon 078 str. F0262]
MVYRTSEGEKNREFFTEMELDSRHILVLLFLICSCARELSLEITASRGSFGS